MSTKKRLFLLDAYALIFRGYYAFIKNPRINSKGMDTSAIMGFTNSLLDLINRERPDHLAVCFDRGGSKSRTQLFSDYKANREETPEPITVAIPYIEKLLNAMHIPTVVKEGFEADDIIGTLAKQAEKQGYQVFMVTPDKDFAQLVSKNIFMYRPSRMGNGIEIWGIPEVQKKFEIEHPEQVIDYLGMMGDAVDNIPGLPGVGDKTAKKLLKTYGNIEAVLENSREIKGKLGEKIEANKAQGLLSKKLATIMLDVPVKFEAEKYKFDDPDHSEANALFDELEFRRIKETFKKIFQKEKLNNLDDVYREGKQFDLFASPGSGFKNEDQKSERKNLSNTEHLYQSVETEMGRRLLLESLVKEKEVCFDTETTSLNALNSELVGIAFSWEAGKGYYLSIPEEKEKALEILEPMKVFFENQEIKKIGHNLKYDLKVLRNYNINVKGKLFDTMVAHYLINPDMRHNMDILAETYLKYSPKSITELIGKKGINQGSMREVSIEDQTEYAVEDADITFQLKSHFEKEMKKTKTLELFSNVEIPLVEVLTDMECEGVKLDTKFLKELSKVLLKDIKSLENLIYNEAGVDFNLASPKQLGSVLFDELKLVEKPKKTKTGQYSTSEDALSSLAKEHKIISNILDWRSLQKLQNTYVEALPNEINLKSGRIHTIYNQAVAATGRLSSNNPNLQNIPVRTERGQQVRKAFIARDENHLLLAADYSQIELRIIAALSKDEGMLGAFKNHEDIHAATAAKVFNVNLDKVSREQRNNAKTINFGIIYGVSAFGLSQQTNLSRTESKELIEAYYSTYPMLRSYIYEQIDFARDNGYVSTILGRRRYLKDINSQNAILRGSAERNAVNAPIQGSAADIIKLAMIAIQKRLKSENKNSKMILQVHDELVFDVPKYEIDEIKILIKEEMENAFKLEVPLVVDIGLGSNWLEAH
ncbi:DNA polymerase I [Bacteroidetes bacterium SCGC AAA795-G10]|nr:DNA polymerase I [Bacteroidetes bacterium SCGC AAA795-G10]